MNNCEKIWSDISDKLSGLVSLACYEIYFSKLKPITIKDDVLILSTPLTSVKNGIAKNFTEPLNMAIRVSLAQIEGAKIILDNNAMMGKSPAEILANTNTSICSHNEAEMFVTVWLGILELSTGRLVAANAGHEYPIVCRPGGSFELVKDRHGFVVGGMPGSKYKEYELTLEPGSKLFLYTDGLPEATDASGNMFGSERILSSLNEITEGSPEEVLGSIRKAVDAFVDSAEQFDDLTMMCVEYKGKG